MGENKTKFEALKGGNLESTIDQPILGSNRSSNSYGKTRGGHNDQTNSGRRKEIEK